jgi:hypothetical protein
MILFILAAVISVKIVINSFSADNDFQELRSEASKISEILMSEGYPIDWVGLNSSDVIRSGLLTTKRLDESKVTLAMNTTYINYTSLRPKLQAKHHLAVVFEQANGSLIQFNNSCVIGNTSISPACSTPVFSFKHKNLVQLTRLAVYNSTIIRMVVYTWN